MDQRLSEMWNQINSSAITKALMVQTVASEIQLHLDSAKEQWMKLVCTVHVYTCTYTYMYMCGMIRIHCIHVCIYMYVQCICVHAYLAGL